MLTFKSRADRIEIATDDVDAIKIAGKNFVIIDFSGFCYHSGGKALLEEYITKNGGVVRKSAVKSTDYAIVCPVAYKYTANYKKPAEDYLKVLSLKKGGKDVWVLSDLDFFIYFDLFSKLRVDNKLRVADVYLNGYTGFSDKAAQRIEKFIKEKQDTYKYKEYFEQPMQSSIEPLYDSDNCTINIDGKQI